MERAFVCVSTENSAIPSVLQKIKTVKGVEQVEIVKGDYDVCFKVIAETYEGLKKTINEHIRKIENVRNTLTTVLTNSE